MDDGADVTATDPLPPPTTALRARPTLPLIEVRGAPRERGRQHGEACREQVRAYAETLRRVLAGEAHLRGLDAGRPAAAPALSVGELYERALTFVPFFEAFAPRLVEEIRGIAEGAGVPFAAALLVNVRAEVAGVRGAARGAARGANDGCTAFAAAGAATAGGAVLLGQNQDQAPDMEALGVVLKVRPDDGPPALMATFGGLVGYPGVNGEGVACFQNALSSGVWRHALPHYPLKRVLLAQPAVAACLGVFDRAALASCGNVVLGDRSGHLLDVEATPDGYAVLEPADGLLVHTNHFQSARYRPHEKLLSSLPDSAARLERMTSLLREAHGRITLDTIKQSLRDHDGGAAGICRHEPQRPMKTIASIIAEPEHGRLHVARGNPCEREYVVYSL
jgi:isopenicillin-N N-acyltransferase-like protein